MNSVLIDIFKELLKFLSRIILRPSKEIARVVAIYDSMHKMLEATDIQRIVIYRVHNSGGLIRPTTPLYISTIYEEYEVPFRSVKEDYQRVLLDEEFIRTLNNLCRDRVVKLYTDEMKDGTLQKSVYRGEGVQYAEMHYLGQDRKNLYFVSLCSAWFGGWHGKPDQELIVSMGVNQIRNNIM